MLGVCGSRSHCIDTMTAKIHHAALNTRAIFAFASCERIGLRLAGVPSAIAHFLRDESPRFNAQSEVRFFSLPFLLFTSLSQSNNLSAPRVLSTTHVIRTTYQGPEAEKCPVGWCDAPNAVSNFLIARSPQKFLSKPFAILSA